MRTSFAAAAAPGQSAGRGSQQRVGRRPPRGSAAAPGQSAGRGSQRVLRPDQRGPGRGSARPKRRARIATPTVHTVIPVGRPSSARPKRRARIATDLLTVGMAQLASGSARPKRRARIATPPKATTVSGSVWAAPGQSAGRGSQHYSLGRTARTSRRQRPAKAPGEDRNRTLGRDWSRSAGSARPKRRARIATSPSPSL